jgi:hypothetical protein
MLMRYQHRLPRITMVRGGYFSLAAILAERQDVKQL